MIASVTRLALGGVLAIAAGGCAVGPDYAGPGATPVGEWTRDAPGVTLAHAPPGSLARWWERFDDSLLTELVDSALAQNHGVRVAVQRVRAARAARQQARSGLWPRGGARAGAERERVSRNADALGPIPGAPPSGFQRERSVYAAGFDASWEIDLFGGTRRRAEAAAARLGAAIEGRRDVQATVAAEVGRLYFELRGAQQRLALARQNLDLQRDTRELVRRKADVGLSTRLDARRAEAAVAATAARIPELEATVRASAYGLGVLTGHTPEHWLDRLAERGELPPLPDVVPAGLRSELLRRRPDIREAERELAAATAEVGVATAELYPSFQLTGLGAFQASDGGDLLAAASFTHVLGAGVRWPVFQGGRIRAGIAAAESEAEVAAIRYARTILEAVQDVETGLVRYARARETRGRLADAVDANRDAAELARKLYHSGLGGFLDVLDAERQLTATEDERVAAETRAAVALVAIYKALGGGWPMDGERAHAAPLAPGTATAEVAR